MTIAPSTLTWTWGEWTPLYHGIEQATHLNDNLPFPAVPIPLKWPRPTIHLLRVRMDDPHITTCSTPESGLNGNGVPLSEFLKTTFDPKTDEGVVGINANFFDMSDSNSRNVLYGLAVSTGATVPWKPRPDGNPYYPLLVTNANQAAVGGADAPRTPDTYTAVSGNVLLLRNGQLEVRPPTSPLVKTPLIAARTAVGVSYDPDYLYLLAIDGLETDDLKLPYYGASDFDAAVLLLMAGATDAINMDGGGSTTMGRIDKGGFALLNVPHGDDKPPITERFVGNCFGVISRVVS